LFAHDSLPVFLARYMAYMLRALALYACYRPSVCLFICLSHACIIQKRLKLGLWNLNHTVAPSL